MSALPLALVMAACSNSAAPPPPKPVPVSFTAADACHLLTDQERKDLNLGNGDRLGTSPGGAADNSGRRSCEWNLANGATADRQHPLDGIVITLWDDRFDRVANSAMQVPIDPSILTSADPVQGHRTELATNGGPVPACGLLIDFGDDQVIEVQADYVHELTEPPVSLCGDQLRTLTVSVLARLRAPSSSPAATG